MANVVEVLEHWAAGRSLRAIGLSLGLDRNTVRKYIRPARASPAGRDARRADHLAAVGQGQDQRTANAAKRLRVGCSDDLLSRAAEQRIAATVSASPTTVRAGVVP